MIRQIPNTLTTLRLLSAPLLVAFLIYRKEGYAFAIFAFAGLTDIADGFLAKRYGLATLVGRYLDPAADKLLMTAAFIALTIVHRTPAWLTLLVIGRDVNIVLAIAAARLLELPLRVQPLPIGKLCTAIQVAYVALVLLFLALGIQAPRTLEVAAVIAAAFTIASWLAYGALWLKAVAARYRPAG